MNSLRVDTYLNVYEIADILAKRAKVNAVHDLALVKTHTVLSKSGDIEVGLEELEQLLSLEGIEESLIINRLAEIDDAMYAVSRTRGNHIGSSYFTSDERENTNHSREIFQRSENYIKDYLYGEKSIVDQYVISLIDIQNNGIKIENIPHKRNLFTQDLNKETSSITCSQVKKIIRNYIRERERTLEENAIKITIENQDVIIDDLKDLAGILNTFDEYILEVNPDENIYPTQGKAAEKEILQIIEDIESCKIDFIRLKSSGYGDNITIETYSRD